MEPTLFQYIRRYSLRQQLWLLLLTAVSWPFLYASLELPKMIINDAIGSQDFPRTAWGIEFEQIPFLMTLCGAFLLLVVVRFGIKYYVNVYKGIVGERMLRRLRYQLFSRVLLFPLPHFRRTSQGELIAMITAEVEPLGGFVGDAVALPAFEGGTLLTILTFIIIQDPILGLAAIALYPLQMYLIPKLQRQVNLLAKERVRTVRKLSERIGETVLNVEEVHVNDASEFERAEFSRWIGTIYDIRFRIYKKKFFIKFLNNFIGQLTPFFFFSIGGYLVITGSLTFGGLVAVLAAYKDLSAPWKELLSWYQQKEDTRVKYEQLIEQFQPAGMFDEKIQELPEGEPPRLDGTLVASNVTLADEGGVKVIEGVSFSFAIGENVALVGGTGAGADAVARLLARLIVPTTGSITINGQNLATLPESVTGRRIGYVGPATPLFSGTIRHNLLYGLTHQPLSPIDADHATSDTYREWIEESKASGNTTSDLDADWIDYAAAGVERPEDLSSRAHNVLSMVSLEADVFTFGLQGTVDPSTGSDLCAQILKAREVLRDRLAEDNYRDLVEPFDVERYNSNMSVAENLLFGAPIGPVFDLEHIGENPYMLSVLDKVSLTDQFISTGLQTARIMVELFQDLPPAHEFFERFSFISADALPEYQAVIRHAESVGLERIDPQERAQLLSLTFKLNAARHRLGLINEQIIAKLLDARREFARNLPSDLRHSVAFFEKDTYNPEATVQDNILFGKLAYGRQRSQQRVGALIAEVIDSLGLRQPIIELGLEYTVGIGGVRLTGAQRQKLAIARCLLKRPDLLILDQALTHLTPSSQTAMLDAVLTSQDAASIVCVVPDAEQSARFEKVLVMEGGRVASWGSTTAPEVQALINESTQ